MNELLIEDDAAGVRLLAEPCAVAGKVAIGVLLETDDRYDGYFIELSLAEAMRLRDWLTEFTSTQEPSNIA